MDNPLIECKSLTKIFEVSQGLFGKKVYIRAVDNVSFEINKGDSISLVGESGCGKSTLGKLVLALLKPTSGHILFEGKDVWKMNKKEFMEYRRNAQIVHQNPYNALNPVRTIYQTLAPPLLRYKIVRNKREAQDKVKELLRLVGLEPPSDFMTRYPSRLSGGQMQRVAIARALTTNPKFLVADEAVSMLDASLRIEVLNLLLDLKKKFDLTCLFITHDLAVARYFSMRGKVMVMYLGNIVEFGNTEEVIQNPLHPYTKALISAVPIPDPKIQRERKTLPVKDVELPSVTEMPSGCKFHSRCPYAEEDCAKKIPELVEIKEGRLVACHQYL
ncbi:MAG: ABC transporter ATP-binding protein [Candidatus Bathyarchaeia archaeon]